MRAASDRGYTVYTISSETILTVCVSWVGHGEGKSNCVYMPWFQQEAVQSPRVGQMVGGFITKVLVMKM